MTRAGSIPSSALEELATPCLVVDLAAAERNIARAESVAAAAGLALRPHFKAHKCSALLARQLSTASAVGATCQTMREALVLARAGVTDILVANEIATRADLMLLPEVTSAARLIVAVDHLDQVALLGGAVPPDSGTLGIVIELDVGGGRCGLGPDRPELLSLADAVADDPRLDLLGVLAYEGHVSLREERSTREALMWQVHRQIRHEVRRLEEAGHAMKVVTGGGTGTLDIVASIGSHTEAQPGSYVLMDATYAKLGLIFEPALLCLATVISRPTPDRAVLDAGLKALSAEYGMPAALTPGLRVTRLADEHAVSTLTGGLELSIGEQVLLQPAHVDPAINLFSRLHVWDGDSMLTWRVDGRTY
jgi:D-threonine aldolase